MTLVGVIFRGADLHYDNYTLKEAVTCQKTMYRLTPN